MEEFQVKLLKLLNVSDKRAALENFCQQTAEISQFDFLWDQEKTDLKLPPYGGFKFSSDAGQQLKDFFHHWAKLFFSRNHSKRDELTGLISRSFWESELKNELLEQKLINSIAMLDIDYFKHFNDNYGHQMGDEVLATVGKTINEFLSQNEKAIRYGGEEFLVVSPRPLPELKKMLERFRAYTENNKLFPNQPEKITMSVGLAECPAVEFSTELTIRQADLALYEAKRGGRNLCRVYAPFMARSENFYIWGIYRYLCEPETCFSLNNNDILIQQNNRLKRYNWHKNYSNFIQPASNFTLPARQLIGGKNVFYLLDAQGKLWNIRDNSDWNLISAESTPEIVRLVGNEKTLFAVGINNQLYKLSENELRHSGSLPEKWEQLMVSNGMYFLKHRSLYKFNDSGTETDLTLTAPPTQVTGTKNSIYIVENTGSIYRFSTTKNQWEGLNFINQREKIKVRELDVYEGRLLARDAAGRLLFARRKCKSVPQRMNI